MIEKAEITEAVREEVFLVWRFKPVQISLQVLLRIIISPSRETGGSGATGGKEGARLSPSS